MSTKATIAHSKYWHLYEDMAYDEPENIFYSENRYDWNGEVVDVVTVRLPREACVALANYVSNKLDKPR